jgi:hypothetical protein
MGQEQLTCAILFRRDIVKSIRTTAGGCLLLTLLLSGCARPSSQSRLAPAGGSSGAGATEAAARTARVSAEKTVAAAPAVAGAPDGTVYAAWVEHRGREADVWLAHFDGEAKSLGQPARVNPNAGGATAWRGDPPTVAVASDGTVYVGWTARDAAAPHASTLYLSASRDGGRSFVAPVKVNDDRGHCDHGLHSLAVADSGRVYVAWLDDRNVKQPEPSEGGGHTHAEPNRELFFASSADGGRTFSANVKIADEVCPCCKTSLAVGDDGRVYAAWRQVLPGNLRHIAVASSDDGGSSFSPAAVVSDDRWELQGCPVSGPSLAAAGGALRVLWYTAGEAGVPGLYWSESRDGGHTFSPRRALAAAGGRGTPVLLRDAGGFKAVWEGGEGTAPVALTAGLKDEGDASEPSTLTGTGALPAAAEAGGRLFVAYIAGGEGEHAVWLARSAAR